TLLFGQLDQDRIMSRQSDQHPLIANALEQVGEDRELVLPVKLFGQGAVRRNADRFMLGRVIDAVRPLVPIALSEAQPIQFAAGSPKSLQVIQRSLGITVLPSVDAGFFHLLKQLDDTLGSVPGRLMLAEHFVEVRIAVYRVA